MLFASDGIACGWALLRTERLQVLRMVSAMLDGVPSTSADALKKELLHEYTDATLVNTLSLLTRGVCECHQLVDTSTAAFPRR